MEAQQCAERTCTNRPRAYPSWRVREGGRVLCGYGIRFSGHVPDKEGQICCRCCKWQQFTVFLDSSMVEHAAVNRGVVGSSPTRGVWRHRSMECRMYYIRGSVVKRLRHRPFTAVTRVRFPSESLKNMLLYGAVAKR